MDYIIWQWIVAVTFLATRVESADPRCATELEVWSECGAQCQLTCAEQGPVSCEKNCVPGCVCQEGLVRTAIGRCIPAKDCDENSMKCPGPNEIYDKCGAHGCQNTCESPFLITYCDPYGCSSGCICERGYYRDLNKTCVSGEICVKCEDVNARWDNDDATMCENTCQRPDLSTYCKPSGPEAGCVCKPGYLKDKTTGKCEPAEVCGHCDDPNAVYSLTGANSCQNTCEAPDIAPRCRAIPRAGCMCKNSDFVKNSKGLCVKLSECSTKPCGVNEHLEKNPPDCPPKVCRGIGVAYDCANVEPPQTITLKCVCDRNHLRDERSICIPVQECPAIDCNNANEVYDPCPVYSVSPSCEDLKNGLPPQNSDPKRDCFPQCRCQDEFYRSPNGACIAKEECFDCSRPNEEYRESGSVCRTTCNNLYSEKPCILAQVIDGCFCKKGFVRDSKNNCIKPQECYKDLCGKNEIRSCGSACDTTCATLGQQCPIINIMCNNMCYCNHGYARDDCGACIPQKMCIVQGGCGGSPHARNVSCPDPCPATCSSYSENQSTEPSPCKRMCTMYGCQCDKGFVRLESSPINYCVDPRDCKKCTGQNEHWSRDEDCSCADLDSHRKKKSTTRKPGCRCMDGFVRNQEGLCIQAGLCPRCGPLEVYNKYGPSCPATCRTKDKITQTMCIQSTTEGCFCKEGLLRNDDGKCVHPRECSGGCDGDPNASHGTYSPTCALSCDNYRAKLVCLDSVTEVGCSCNEGFVKDPTSGLCVTTNKCLEGCGGDVNADFLPCGNNCEKTCEHPEDRPCTKMCKIGGGCGCKAGYVKGANGRCILPSQCPKKCDDVNAVFMPCGNNCPRDCKNPGPRPCPEICKLLGECGCKPGYVEGPDKKCILPSECPNACGGDINASNMSYNPDCVTTCDNYKEKIECNSKAVTQGCSCNKGYIYDQIAKKCVLAKDCPAGCRGDPNARFYPCTWCPQTCSRLNDQLMCIALCRYPGNCGCNSGYVLNDKGICVRPKACPPKRCARGEKWDCPRYCRPNLCSEKDLKYKCPPQTQEQIDFCTPNCVCKEGRLRDDNGNCILEDQCPPTPQ